MTPSDRTTNPVPTPRPGCTPNPLFSSRLVVTLTTAGRTRWITATTGSSPAGATGRGRGRDRNGCGNRPRAGDTVPAHTGGGGERRLVRDSQHHPIVHVGGLLRPGQHSPSHLGERIPGADARRVAHVGGDLRLSRRQIDPGRAGPRRPERPLDESL